MTRRRPHPDYFDVTLDLEVWLAGITVDEFERMLLPMRAVTLYDLDDMLKKMNGKSIEAKREAVSRAKTREWTAKNPRRA